MPGEAWTIGELADAAGITRRAVRFYVQRGLLAPPTGLGRGGHYTGAHLAQLRRVAQLQAAGHSLAAIARMLPAPAGPATPAEPVASRAGFVGEAAATARRETPPPTLTASLWGRYRLAEGVELHLDTARREPSVEQLLAIRGAVRGILGLPDPARAAPPRPANPGPDASLKKGVAR